MNTNPFLTSTSSSSNNFLSNLYSNQTRLNFNNNNNNTTMPINPFKMNNSINNNNILNTSSNNNDIFSRIRTNISDNTNTNIFNNNNSTLNNPFKTNLTNNNITSNIFSNNNINNNNFSFGKSNNNNFLLNNQNQNNQMNKTYYFNNGITVELPMCQTVGKSPITTFNNDLRYLKDYSEKNKLEQKEYLNARLEYICNDPRLKDYSIEEIRMNDYINAKIPFFDKWNNSTQNNNNFLNKINSGNFLNNNNNTFSIFNQNNTNTFMNNTTNNFGNSTNPFINNSNNNNNNNLINTSNNPFNSNNNNKINIFNNNTTINTNSNLNNPFNSISTNNNNIFNNTNNNNIFSNTNNNNIFNNNNNNTNNIFKTNIFNTNSNNIFNNANQNPFNSILNTNNNINNTSFINNNNNNLVNNIFNNNMNNFYEKPFEEKIKDPTWVKRNVRIIEEDTLDNWISDYINDISKVNLRVKEMQYFGKIREENNNKDNEEIIEPKNLIFNKIILPSDEEISNYNKNKKQINSDNKNTINNNANINNKWDPIHLHNNKNEKLYSINNNIENNFSLKQENGSKYELNNNFNKKGRLSGFAEASIILSNFDNNYVDFNINNNEQKEYILPTEKPEFKFNNNLSNNNKQSYNYSAYTNNNENYENKFNDKIMNNNNHIQDMDLVSNNTQSLIENGNYEINDINQNDDINKNYMINNNNNFYENDNINEDIISLNNNNSKEKENILDQECKLIYIGESNLIPELKIPIIIPISSLILNETLLNFDFLIETIKKNILSIDDIENKIKLPSDEEIYIKLNGKIFSKLTSTEIYLNQIEKNFDNFEILYGFKIQKYPLITDNEYTTKPKLDEILNPEKNFNIKKIQNFEVSNKFGKIIFLDPIDLSGKIIINEIIKINEGEIDVSHSRVDKLKAKAFLFYDFGDKLEGTFLDNIKYFLKNRNSNFIKYENKILEYSINF